VVVGKLLGTVWLAADGRVLISDYRDYVKVLQEARSLDPRARVMAVEQWQVPVDAVQVL
jgi:poly-beta-hydroxyalkanoate depolymerase